MKKYLGIKLVEAEPEYKPGLRHEGDTGIPLKGEGYKVVYEDGYESWSPKDVFEKAYREIYDRIDSENKTLLPHQDRVISEAIELKEKVVKLMGFIYNNNAIYNELPDIEKTDLKQQLLAMQYYLTILTSRINRF